MPQSNNPLVRLWNLVREQKGDILSIYFFAALTGLIQLSLPVGIQAIIGFVLAGTMSASLVVLITFIVTAVLLSGLMQINQMKIIEKIQQNIFVKYSYAFAEKIPGLDLKKVDAFYLPELVNRFFDTVSLQKSIAKLLLDLPVATIQIFFGLILLSFYHPFFIVFGILLLALLWLMLYATGNKGLHSSLAESSYKYAVAGWFEEMARLIKTFKLSSSYGLHLSKTNEKTINYLNARTEHFHVLLFQYRVLVAFKVIITAAMLIVGVVLLLNQQINIGQFVAAEIIIITVITAVEKIITNLDSLYDTLTAVEKISKLTDKPSETFGSYCLNGEAIRIEARHLNFSYDAALPVIKDQSFVIEAAQKVCITGGEGAGKSTLLKLLTGSYKDFTGALLVNHIPIGNYDLNSLRSRTGIYFPYENIFHGTLWDNISMGRTDIDKTLVTELCIKTGLDGFLASTPDGFDTELDPTGKRLSRNVIQKILLVRALAHKPKLLLLEDPFHGMDEMHGKAMQQMLLELQDTTVIIASNDASFASRCDKIINLDK